jgi:hypothetical protein
MMDGVEKGEDQRFLSPQGFGEILENQLSKDKAVSQRRKPLDRTLEKTA